MALQPSLLILSRSVSRISKKFPALWGKVVFLRAVSHSEWIDVIEDFV